MITIGNNEYYSREEIIEALDYIKEKKMKKYMKCNLAFDKFRYIGGWCINYSFDELPKNSQIGDIVNVTWPNDRIHYRDSLDNSISSGDLLVYTSIGWIKYNQKTLYNYKEIYL